MHITLRKPLAASARAEERREKGGRGGTKERRNGGGENRMCDGTSVVMYLPIFQRPALDEKSSRR